MICSNPFVNILVYHLQPWLDVARWRCINAPNGLATYWVHALLITLQGREKRPHSELILAWYCCIDAAGVALVHCSDVLDVQRLNLCLRVVQTGHVEPVTC